MTDQRIDEIAEKHFRSAFVQSNPTKIKESYVSAILEATTELRKDSERLDWLDNVVMGIELVGPEFIQGPSDPRDLRTAIDAAMKVNTP